jgi:hypothetical protein
VLWLELQQFLVAAYLDLEPLQFLVKNRVWTPATPVSGWNNVLEHEPLQLLLEATCWTTRCF